MTKINFENQGVQSKVVTKIEDTVETLKKIERIGNTARVPYDFNSSLYRDALRDVKKTASGLDNIKDDLTRAGKNYEAAELNCKRSNNTFTKEFKIELDEPIIHVD